MSFGGQKNDVPVEELNPGGTTSKVVTMADVKYGEASQVKVTLKNTELFTLKDYSYTASPNDSGFTITSPDPSLDCTRDAGVKYNESCGLLISYLPTTGVPPHNTDFVFSFKNPKGETVEFKVSFTAPSLLADLVVTSTDLTFLKTQIYGSVASSPDYLEKEIHVTNHGTGTPVTLTSIALTGTEFSDVSAGAGYCTVGSSVAGDGGSCIVKVRYRPTQSGEKTSTLTIAGVTPDATSVTADPAALSVTAVALTSNSATMDFGTFLIGSGTNPRISATFTNPHSDTASLAESCTPAITGAQFSIQSTTCTGTLTDAASCNVVVEFNPGAVSADYTGSLSLTCDKRAGSTTVAITGTAMLVQPLLQLTDDRGNTTYANTIALSDITGATGNANNIVDLTPAYREATYTVKNAGLATANTLALSGLSGVFSVPGGSDACTGNNLAPAATCTFKLRYTPATDNETTSQTLTVGSVSAVSGLSYTAVVAAVKGTSIPVPKLRLIDDHGNVVYANTIALSDITGATGNANNIVDLTPTNRDVTYTLKNVGAASASSFAITGLSGVMNLVDASNNCAAATLALNQTCTFVVRYTPATDNETTSQTLTVTGTSAITSAAHTATVTAVKGTSIPVPKLRLIDDRGNTTYANTIALSDITGATGNTNNIVNLTPTTRDVTYTLKNVGNASVTSFAMTGLSGVMSLVGGSNNCAAATLALNQTCTFVVRYTPATDNETTSQTLTVTGTSAITSATTTAVVTAVKGTSIPIPSLKLIDDRGNAVYTNTIALSDITGATGDTNNILNLTPTTRDVTYTLKNVGTASATSFAMSGLSGVMSVVGGSNNCASATLATNQTCTFVVRYTPTTDNETTSQTLTVTGASTITAASYTATVTAVKGTSLPIPKLRLIDDRGNTTYANTIALSDITGLTDDANNIVNKTPSSRDVTYTLKNVGNASVNTITITGLSGTMAVAGAGLNTCAPLTLATNDTCTFVVRYTPATNNETTSQTMTVTGTSTVTATNVNAAVTAVKGTSITAASLSILSGTPVELGPIATGANTNSNTLVLHNSGIQTATGLTFNFVNDSQSVYSSITTGLATPCGSSLAGGASCDLKVKFTPSLAGAFGALLRVAGSQSGDNFDTSLKAVAQKEDLSGTGAGFDLDGVESHATFDADRVYVASRYKNGASDYQPVITTCSRTATGSVNAATCSRLNLKTLFGGAGSNFAGSQAGSGPKIAHYGTKLFVAIENQDTSLGGDAANSTKTLVVCNKPPVVGNPIDSSTCTRTIIDSTAGSGQYVSIAATSTKVFIASMNISKKLLIHACTFNNASTSNPDLAASCASTDAGSLADEAYHPSIGFVDLGGSGQKVIVSTRQQAAPDGLRIFICSFNSSNNAMTTCTSSTSSGIDNSGVVDTTSGSGRYSNLAIDSTTLYIAHQVGADDTQLRLSKCSFTAATNAITASPCTTTTVSSASGTGGMPQVALSTTRAWVSSVSVPNDFGYWDPETAGSINVWKCTKASMVCAGSTYYTQAISQGLGSFYSRSLVYDSTYNIFLSTFENSSTGGTKRLGFLSLGVLPELP